MPSCFSCLQLFATPWTLSCQAPLSMRFSRQEYWARLPCPPPEDLPNPGTETSFLRSPVLAGGFLTACATWEGSHLKSCVNLMPLCVRGQILISDSLLCGYWWFIFFLKLCISGTSLVAQWLRFQAPSAEGPAQGTRPHTLGLRPGTAK